MRLTLRTLLAYLDDTLEPTQAKIIGQKVAESEQARELMEHIKQVTRRRRITTPPLNGTGGKFDPNTIAEYLDGAVSAEQAGEVEQVCLGSDVHLAEVAACHQILALVLGEPALVPPTAKMRMYSLVKGPESIPFRKPMSFPNLAVEHETTPHGEDDDETLRMGLPSAKAGRGMQFLLLVSACIAAASLLALAIYHVLNLPGTTGPDHPPGGNNVAQLPEVKKPIPTQDSKVPPRVEPKVEAQKDPKVEPKPKPKPDDDFPPLPPPAPIDSTKPKPGPNDSTTTPQDTLLPEYRYFDPDNRAVKLGKYVSPQAKDPTSIVVNRPVAGGQWKRLWGSQSDVLGGRTYVALPGCRGDLLLERGVQLTLWGNLPEVLPSPPIFESVVDLHSHDAYDLDLTLRRGRIVLTSTKDKPAIVRVRTDNPAKPKSPPEATSVANTFEVVDIAVQGKGSQVLIDRGGAYPPGVPFVKDPTSADRIPPAAFLAFWALKGNATVRLGDTTYTLSAPPGRALMVWNSLKGLSAPQQVDALPDAVSANPPAPPGIDKKLRADILKARDDMSQLLANNGVDVGLAETMKDSDSGRRVMVVRCYAALGDLAHLVEALGDTAHPEVRMTAIQSMRNWIAVGRDNEYKLFDQLKTRFKAGESEKMMELLHGFENPELLVDHLNNSNLAIRQLAHMNLLGMLPKGLSIAYDPMMDPPHRVEAQKAWRDLLHKEANAPPPPGPMN